MDDDGVSESLSGMNFRIFSIVGINIQTISNEVYNRRGKIRRFIATRDLD
ncbi:hypothetical protein [Bacillus cereus]|nr:hypothetical protein [Bacillus cereus]